MPDRTTGRVKFFSTVKGYGFIERDDGQRPDVFVHAKNLPDGIVELEPDQKVSFIIGPGKDGKSRATKVLLG